MTVPPGLRFLCRVLPIPLVSIVLVHYAVVYGCNVAGYTPPSFKLFALAVVTLWLPVLSVVRRWEHFMNGRRARANGAILPPMVRDWTPFNVGIIKKMVNRFKRGYPGNCCHLTWPHFLNISHPGELQLIWHSKVGNTFAMRTGLGELVRLDQWITWNGSYVRPSDICHC